MEGFLFDIICVDMILPWLDVESWRALYMICKETYIIMMKLVGLPDKTPEICFDVRLQRLRYSAGNRILYSMIRSDVDDVRIYRYDIENPTHVLFSGRFSTILFLNEERNVRACVLYSRYFDYVYVYISWHTDKTVDNICTNLALAPRFLPVDECMEIMGFYNAEKASKTLSKRLMGWGFDLFQQTVMTVPYIIIESIIED
jgi:hypothetical protein